MSIAIQTNGVSDGTVESEIWKSKLAELAAERDQLREELVKVKRERDTYLKTAYHYLCKDYSPPAFTKEEVFACLENEPTLGELIEQLKVQYLPGK